MHHRLSVLRSKARLAAQLCGALLLATGLAAAGTVTYTYDELGRLRVVTQGTESFHYSFDPAGNRTLTAPAGGAAQFSSANYAVTENGSNVVVTVQRVGGSGGSASVNYATSNGTALAGSDYTAKTGTLFWASGETTAKTFAITILDDAVYEGSESLNVTLSGASGMTLGSPSATVVTISDNESPPTGTLQLSAATYSVAENGGSITVSVTRTGGSSGSASVNYATSNGTATAGSDYTSSSGSLSWTSADAATKTFVIPILDDGAYEGNETVNITLSGATGASLSSPASAVLTITDNDPAPTGSLQLSASTYAVAENASSVTISVTRLNGSAGAASVNYATSNGTATSGSDYTGASGTLNWTSGDTAAKTFTVAILNDSTYEGNESFGVSLSAANGASMGTPSAATVSITEDDPPPDTTAPSVPTGLTATAVSQSQINLSWNASTDTGGSGLAGYRIYRDGAYLTSTPSTSYSNGSLSAGTTYGYTVAAYDNATNVSAQSASASATTTPLAPGAPSWTNFSNCTTENDFANWDYYSCYALAPSWSVTLAWAPGTGTATSYVVEVSNDGAAWSQQYSGASTSTALTLYATSAKYFRVRSCNSGGCSANAPQIYLGIDWY